MARSERCWRTLVALREGRDGYWECDLRDGSLWLSPGFHGWLGLDDPASPQPALPAVWQRLHPQDRRHFLRLWRDARRSGHSFAVELRLRDAHDHWHWLRVQARGWPDEAQATAQASRQATRYLSGLASDAQPEKLAWRVLEQQSRLLETQVAERTESLAAALRLAEQQRLEAERVNAAKTRFLAHVSHEIRAPLAGLLGLTELALRGAHGDSQRRHLQQALDSGRMLHQIISDVLDLSRIESGRQPLRSVDFDPAQLLAETLRALMPLADERALALLFDFTGAALPLHGDDSALRQIVTNLLSNAIRYTPLGEVALQGHVQPLADGRQQLTVQVRDNGPGIPLPLRQMLFEPFVRGSAPPARGHAGAGLGLAIAQGLARAMGGELGVDCPAGGGSVFTLTLALPAASSAPVRLPLHPADARLGVQAALDAEARQRLRQRPLGLLGRWASTQLSDRAAAGLAADAACGPALEATAARAALAQRPSAPRAWLVYAREAPGRQMCARLERLGWPCTLMLGLPAVLSALQRPEAEPPALLLLAEPAVQPLIDLAALRHHLPHTTLHLLIPPDWHEPALEAQARALGIVPLLAPLTPQQLRQLGQATPPLAPGDAAPGADRQPDDSALQGEVLLVEDNEVSQIIGREFLSALGLTVHVAHDGEQALEVCTRRRPALVLMDLQLPDMDGLEVTARLRDLQRDGAWPGAPIVALTAHASADDRAACQAAGMAAVLTKPLSLDLLRRELPRWL